MNIAAIRSQGLRAILGGRTDLEYRDRLIGLTFTLVGLMAMAALPEAREVREYFNSNTPNINLIVNVLFIGSFLTFIGPCLMLPYRFGAMPLAAAVLWSVLQVHGAMSSEQTTGVRLSSDSTHTTQTMTLARR